MAEGHPVLYPIQPKIPIKKNIELWCGSTFVDVNQRTAALIDYTLLEYEQFKPYEDVVDSHPYNTFMYFLSNYLYDKVVLNIRAKTDSWSDLGKVLWQLELPLIDPIFPDRDIYTADSFAMRIEIPAEITEQMLQSTYTYELLLVTTQLNNYIDGNLLLTENGPNFSFKELYIYGDILTHQIGEI